MLTLLETREAVRVLGIARANARIARGKSHDLRETFLHTCSEAWRCYARAHFTHAIDCGRFADLMDRRTRDLVEAYCAGEGEMMWAKEETRIAA